MLIYRRDALKIEVRSHIPADDAYFKMISEGWSAGLREAFQKIPDPVWS